MWTIGCSAAAVSGSARPNASTATTSVVGKRVGIGSPSRTSETRAKVSASRANQPVVSELGACGIMPVRSSRPWVGRMPYRPQKLAGTRTDPPVSVPSAVSHRPWATAEAEPDEDPPGTRSGALGLSGVPSNGFSPRMPSDTSSVTVLPISVAPASSRRCTAHAWRVGAVRWRGQSGLPPPVG